MAEEKVREEVEKVEESKQPAEPAAGDGEVQTDTNEGSMPAAEVDAATPQTDVTIVTPENGIELNIAADVAALATKVAAMETQFAEMLLRFGTVEGYFTTLESGIDSSATKPAVTVPPFKSNIEKFGL